MKKKEREREGGTKLRREREWSRKTRHGGAPKTDMMLREAGRR